MLLGSVLGFGFAGCVIDSKDLCGPNQVTWGDDERCVCAPGTAYTDQGCVTCGEHEVASANGCVCDTGFARSAPDQACIEPPAELGKACSSDADCSAPLGHCQLGASGGYCTSTGCSSPADCLGGYDCITGASPSYCRRPPLGAGKTCASPADCAGTEALFCDTFFTFTCIVQDCNVSANDCFTGLTCCDGSAYSIPNLCVPSCAP